MAVRWKISKRRRPLPTCVHQRRVLLLTGTVTALAVLLTSCCAEENVNVHYGKQPEKIAVAAQAVDNDDDFDVPSAPEMAPIEGTMGRSTEWSGVGREEDTLGVRTVSTPWVSSDEERQNEAGPAAAATVVLDVGSAATLEETAVHSVANAGGANDADGTVAAGAAIVSIGVAGAPDGATADAREYDGHEHGGDDIIAFGEEDQGDRDEDGDDVGADHANVASELDDAREKTRAGLAEGDGSPASAMDRGEDGGAGMPGVDVDQDDEIPPKNRERDEKVAIVGLRKSGDEEDEVGVGVFPNELDSSYRVVASGAVGLGAEKTAAGGLSNEDRPASTLTAVGDGADPDIDPATGEIFVAPPAKSDERQQRQPPLPPSTSETGSSFDAEAYASAANADDGAAATSSRVFGGNDLQASFSKSNSDGDNNDERTAKDDHAFGPRSSDDTPDSVASAADGELQQPMMPGDSSSFSTTGLATPAISDRDVVQVMPAEEALERAAGTSRIGGGVGAHMNRDRVADRARPGAGSTERLPDGVDEITVPELRTYSSDRNGGSRSYDVILAAGEHEDHRGGVVGRRGEDTHRSHGRSGNGSEAGDVRKVGDTETEMPRGSPDELARRVRDMEAELVRKLLAEEDAKSLLDIWVEKAREYILTQTVPPTDAECDFSWSRLRCEPKCSCGARLRFGDYTPGRACRLLHPWERSPDLCGEDGEAAAWDPSDEPALRRVVAAVSGALGGLRRAYEARVAPPSDPECRFSLETRRCEPQPQCRLRVRWGDVTLSSACRLATIPEENAPAAAAAVAADRHTKADGRVL